MQQSGEYRIEAPREVVWRALNDPDILRQCIDGCQTMEKTADDSFKAKVRARIGPLGADFNADVRLIDVVEPETCTIEASVKGGPAGFGKGKARVTLAADGDATLLSFEAEGSVGGKLAQVGQRLVDGAARKLADHFFSSFRDVVAPPAPDASPDGRTVAAGWRNWSLWALPAMAVALAAAFIFRGKRKAAD